jgi:hemoglobin-like flavoprotein
MKAEDIARIRASFARLAGDPEGVAAVFYGNLFAADPAVAALFRHTDLKAQGRKLMAALAMVVAGLDRLGAILPQVEAMAVRHVTYGVDRKHYDLVGAALLKSLGDALGDDFTPDLSASWAAAYGTLAGAMTDAAYGRRPGAAA